MPKIFALRAVHRQTAASRSTKPPSREQQELVGTVPRFMPLSKPSTSAQAPSFSASIGQLLDDGGVAGGVVGGVTGGVKGGVGGQLPFGGVAGGVFGGAFGGQLLFGGFGGGVAHFALARTKKKRLTARKSVA
ncbi:hypothetical protein FCM35_KLT00637 [Carex littledalei]|uniref:Uncharacterized protein n=1 Tax=Carex littledalei TaxID=544730 RepID=A0A833W3G4_9POAL|nr:hypothetical protein FCM35_KLT00637 [Carex littledalei]